jgi:hypothetical protein
MEISHFSAFSMPDTRVLPQTFRKPHPDIAFGANRSIACLPGSKVGGAPGKQLDSQINEFANCRACAIAGAFASAA